MLTTPKSQEAEEEVTATKEFMDFEETLKKLDKDIPMCEWILLSCHAGKGLAEAVRAVNDAYKLGFILCGRIEQRD